MLWGGLSRLPRCRTYIIKGNITGCSWFTKASYIPSINYTKCNINDTAN